MTPELSVVVPTYNRKETLSRVLEGLAAQTLARASYEVIVVDDGSCDGTGAFLKEYSAPFRFEALLQANTGPAGARNRAIRAAAGEIVVFLGDDTVPEEDFLDVHLRAHRAAATPDERRKLQCCTLR